MLAPLIIIQARMDSCRLPGKVMTQINGRPAIDLMIERLYRVEETNNIVVATSVQPGNDPLCQHLDDIGVPYVRGSEDDVLSRFSDCATQFPNEILVRATADCPFIEPEILIKLVNHHIQHDADYSYLSPNFAEGLDVEVIKKSALLLASKSARKTSEREHVTLYFSNNAKQFKIFELNQERDDSKYRFTLDTIEDLNVIKKISSYFVDRLRDVSAEEIIQFLDDHPDVFCLNSNIIRNEGLILSLNNEE